jgi:hypothetical protein
MSDPVVIPLPTALGLIALLAAVLAYRRWLERPITWAPRPVPAGRHRLDGRTEPFRDWAAIAAERMYEQARRQYADEWNRPPETQPPLALADLAGHDDRPTESWPAGMFGLTWDTEEMAVTR